MTEATETPQEARAPTPPAPSPAEAAPAAPPLVVLGGGDDDLACVDDTCQPPRTAA